MYQKEGQCCLEKINHQKIAFHSDCAYFVKKKEEKKEQT